MREVILEVTQLTAKRHILQVGDVVKITPPKSHWDDIEGVITHIFAQGRMCILDDTDAISTNGIFMVNGLKIK